MNLYKTAADKFSDNLKDDAIDGVINTIGGSALALGSLGTFGSAPSLKEAKKDISFHKDGLNKSNYFLNTTNVHDGLYQHRLSVKNFHEGELKKANNKYQTALRDMKISLGLLGVGLGALGYQAYKNHKKQKGEIK